MAARNTASPDSARPRTDQLPITRLGMWSGRALRHRYRARRTRSGASCGRQTATLGADLYDLFVETFNGSGKIIGPTRALRTALGRAYVHLFSNRSAYAGIHAADRTVKPTLGLGLLSFVMFNYSGCRRNISY